MGTIVAVGGGEWEDEETFPIDEKIVELTGKENPKALFIPTASDDAEGYIETFHEVYGDRYSCETESLQLVEENPSDKKIKQKIEDADLLYVGGGNTRKMMKIWRERNVDKYLKEAHENGNVMSGLSAGAICWFEYGHSDSESFESEDDDWNFIKVEGLGIVEDVIYCPHYHVEDREEDFREMMEENPGKTGLAVDNNAAIKVEDGDIEVLRSKEDAKAYRLEAEDGKVIREEL